MIPTPVEFWTLNGTLVGAVGGNTLVSGDGQEHFTAGKLGQAWEPALTLTQVLRGPTPSINPGNTSWSMSAWVCLHSVEEDLTETIFQLRTGTSGMRIRAVIEYSPYVDPWIQGIVLFFGSTTVMTVDTAELQAGWNHISITIQVGSPTSIAIYVNGTKYTATTTTAVLTAASPILWVGGSHSTLFGTPLQAIDGFGWWSVVLSDADVAAIYNAGAGWEYSLSDDTPDAFDFTDVTDAELGTQYTSDAQQITGMDTGTAISVTGGEYRINGGVWATGPGTIDPGQTLELRATSSSESEGIATVFVTVGTQTVDWTITTKAGSTLKQHLILGPTGIIQPVGACVIVPGWV